MCPPQRMTCVGHEQGQGESHTCRFPQGLGIMERTLMLMTDGLQPPSTRVSTSAWKIQQWPLPDLPLPSTEGSVSPQARGCWFILQIYLERMVSIHPLQLTEGRVVEMWSQVGVLILTRPDIPLFFPLCSESDWGCSLLNYCTGQQRLP